MVIEILFCSILVHLVDNLGWDLLPYRKFVPKLSITENINCYFHFPLKLKEAIHTLNQQLKLGMDWEGEIEVQVRSLSDQLLGRSRKWASSFFLLYLFFYIFELPFSLTGWNMKYENNVFWIKNLVKRWRGRAFRALDSPKAVCSCEHPRWGHRAMFWLIFII